MVGLVVDVAVITVLFLPLSQVEQVVIQVLVHILVVEVVLWELLVQLLPTALLVCQQHQLKVVLVVAVVALLSRLLHMEAVAAMVVPAAAEVAAAVSE
jgi:hypothetical protein